ncbi:uncharacterized protein LOC129808633 [Phlebotomus papatasi]|uniref:uncharacterized protein LOC129808633 n=1 Tax=Phlebotomus papatasi TaxID=29031 RepID=UPI002483A934|nr:uncharacterized protein LOC129808633 [Phlebotomus papatasi]
MGVAFIQKGNFKLAHVIHIENFKEIATQIEKLANKYQNLDHFSDILKNKIFEINKIFPNFDPKLKNKRAIEWIGSAIKWATGNADAQDIRDIHRELSDSKLGINKLIKNNNKQVEINKNFEIRINNMIKTISGLLKSNLEKKDNTLTYLEVINLLFHIDELHNKLKAIEEAIMLSKLGVVSKSLLTPMEMNFITEKLYQQNIRLRYREQIFKYLSAAVLYEGETIVYVVDIPQIREDECMKLIIETFPINGQQIKIDYKHLLVCETETYAIIRGCTKIDKGEICSNADLLDISNDSCTPAIARGRPGSCPCERSPTKTIVKQLKMGIVLVKTANPSIPLNNSCGIERRNISGAFLIIFENCTLQINEGTYENRVFHMDSQPVILPLPDVVIQREETGPEEGLRHLEDLHIQNMDALDEMKSNHQTTSYFSYSGFCISAIILTSAIIIWSFKKTLYRRCWYPKPTENTENTVNRDDSTLRGEQLNIPMSTGTMDTLHTC